MYRGNTVSFPGKCAFRKILQCVDKNLEKKDLELNLIDKQSDYLYNNLCRALSAPGRLPTVPNVHLEAEFGEGLIVQIGDGPKKRI